MAGETESIEELKRKIAASREKVLTDTNRLRTSLNVPLRIKTKLARHPWLTAAGGLVAGFVSSKALFTLARSGAVTGLAAGLGANLLRAGVTAAVPRVTALISQKIQAAKAKQTGENPPNRPA